MHFSPSQFHISQKRWWFKDLPLKHDPHAPKVCRLLQRAACASEHLIRLTQIADYDRNKHTIRMHWGHESRAPLRPSVYTRAPSQLMPQRWCFRCCWSLSVTFRRLIEKMNRFIIFRITFFLVHLFALWEIDRGFCQLWILRMIINNIRVFRCFH